MYSKKGPLFTAFSLTFLKREIIFIFILAFINWLFIFDMTANFEKKHQILFLV